jgi:hypothetical protein
MQKGEIELTQKDAENTPAGGVVVGKRDGQTMIYDDASLGGYFVGKLHKDGGIKMINKSTGQPLEVQGSEVIITAPAVYDKTKRNFEGKMMTNREILSKINSDGGGVSFADGGDIPAKIHTTDKEYEYGGKMVHDSDIAHSLGMNSTLKKGKQHFSSGGITYDVDAIYNAIKKGKLRLKTKEVDTFPMKYPVYDKQYSETVKTDLRKPNGIMVRLESGEEVLIDGNHRMNNAYLKGRKTMKTYYVEDPNQIAKFTKKNKFELGGENKKASIMAKKDISSHYNELNDPFDDRKDSENWRKYALPYDTKFDIEFKKGGHLSKNKSLKQIAEMHNVSLAHINEQLAKGLEVEKEHFADFKERTKVAKDHLVENPNYYSILEKSGLKMGGHLKPHHLQKEDLAKDAKSGNTPARDLNNYNDVMDLEADGAVGGDSGLFADGGETKKDKSISDLSEEDLKLYDRASNVRNSETHENNRYYTYLGISIYHTSENRNNIFVENVDKVFDNFVDAENYIQNNEIEESAIPFWIGTEERYYELHPDKKGTYAKGGVVYDTTKPKIEKVTIKETKYSRASVIGRNASTISELQQIVSDYIGSSPKEEIDWVKFYVNDNTRGGYYINLNKGKKNTVANVNPETLNSSNFKRVIDANAYLAKNYDWTDFFDGATASKQTAKDNSVTAISINYDNATTGKSGGMALASSTSKLYSDLIELYQNRSQNVTIQPIGNKLGVNPIEINIYSEDWQTILFKQPLEVALTSINRILYGLFPELNFDKFVRATSAISQTPTASTSAKPFDFSLTKIDISNNPDLSQKVQKRAFELGWEWENGGGKTIDYNDFNYLYFTKTSISSGNTNSSFVNSPKREITEAEIFGSQTPTASTSTATVSKDNSVDLVELRYNKGVVDYVNQSRTGEELLQKFNAIEDYLLKNPNQTISVYISAEVVDKTGRITATTERIDIGKNALKPSNFSYDEMKELIQEKWFVGKLDFNDFFNKSKLTSAKPFDLSKTKIKVDGDRNLSKKIQEKAFELGWGWGVEIKKDVQSTGAYCLLFLENKQIDAYYTEVAFKEATDYREITVDELFGSQTPISQNNKIEPYDVYATTLIWKDNSDKEIIERTDIFYGASGATLISQLKNIEAQSQGKYVGVKIKAFADDDKGNQFEKSEYFTIGENALEPSTVTNEEIKSVVEKRIDGVNFDKFFEDVIPLKGNQTPASSSSNIDNEVTEISLFYNTGGNPTYYSGLKDGKSLMSAINSIESSNLNSSVSVTFTVSFKSKNSTGFTTEKLSDIFNIGKDAFKPSDYTVAQIKEIIANDWFDRKLNFDKFFSDVVSSAPVVPKTVENTVYDLGLAISKLEKASSAVVSDYNKDVYDQSLKFLYDTKATYELALKFTPESAFMYERLDIMKKLADIEKNIKKIEDMKKGGAFYMLAKILEKLQRGENWRLMEQTQDVITNQLPQSEIDIIIRSQKFKNWFGDWEKALVNDEYDNVSKALTNGTPSVYHHGARRKKYTYREVSNGVLYLAENISYALWFSQNATAQSEEGNYLTECFVNIKNPIDLTAFHVKEIDFADLIKYIDAIYPLANIYDFVGNQVALLVKANQPTNIKMRAWQLIRSYAKFVNHIKENTPYDGFLYYENNPSDEVLNPITGQMEENVTKAVAIFKSPQVKVVDAVLFDGGLDDWRFENGGKIKN